MPPRLRSHLGETGVTLIDVMVGLTILAFVTVALLNIFISGIVQARTSGVRGKAAAWAQSEIDYLRYVGYTSSCLDTGARTITSTSIPCTSVEPPLPADLAQAIVQIEDNVGQSGLKRIGIEIERASGVVLYKVVTYETQFQ